MKTTLAHHSLRWITFLIVCLLASGCLPQYGAGLRSLPENQSPVLPKAAHGNPAETIIETATTTPPVVEITTQPSQAAAAPLRFTLPTQDAAPISLWRPALYQTPWALGPFDHFFFTRPIAADEVNWPLADYRYGGIFPGTDIVHTGIDIDAPKYTPVLAAAKGTVIWADYGLFAGAPTPNDPYGLAVAVRHDFGWNGQRLYTIYAHMDKIMVKSGQELEAGEQIGVVGETGKVTGPHLHFEVRIKNNNFFTTLNPELWLAPPVGWGVLVGQLENTNGSWLDTQDVTVISKDSQRRWVVRSYGPRVVNRDSYYQENLVLSDLPAGNYTILVDYLDDRYSMDVTIHPGAITYFTFQGAKGFGFELPQTPTIEDWLEKTPGAP